MTSPRTCTACAWVFYAHPGPSPRCPRCDGVRLQAPHSDDLAEIARRGGAAFESVAPPVDPCRPRGPLFGAGELEREGERRAPARMDTTRARYALAGLLAGPDDLDDPDDDLPW